MKRLLDRIFQLEEINGDGLCPTYLFRWTLLRVGSLAIYLHKFVGDDWSLDLHDHPKRFISIGLWGWYDEHTTTGARRWSAPWIRSFPPTHVHRLTGPTPQRACWTIVIVGRTVQLWGFWRVDQFGRLVRWWPWREYLKSSRSKEQRSCV